MDMQGYVKNGLRQRVFVEAKNASSWWDRLPGKQKKKVIGFLGLDKGRDKKLFKDLPGDERAEIEAYFKKHRGVVESKK
jgi:hypothetical protein